jgi:hypothetical protein
MNPVLPSSLLLRRRIAAGDVELPKSSWTPTPSPTPTPTPSPLVTVVGVEVVKGKNKSVTEIVVDLSGPVNAAHADDIATYRLTTANGKGAFTAN